LKILLTSGGCEEPVDGVRFLTNFSTGKTGANLASALHRAGHNVFLLAGNRTELPPEPSIRKGRFSSYDDLSELLFAELKNGGYGCVIMAAAVSDFGVESITVDSVSYPPGSGKIPSQNPPVLTLKKHPKLIGKLKEVFPELRVIGFKLTNTPDQSSREEAVTNLLRSAGPDFIIANDLSEIDQDRHPFRIYNRSGMVVAAGESKSRMAQGVLSILRQMEREAGQV
jgi:phosphopantothenoylcysteine synthetase/decarboxylase